MESVPMGILVVLFCLALWTASRRVTISAPCVPAPA